MRSTVGRSGRHRRHISGIVRLPVVRPDLGHQAREPTPLGLRFQQGFGAWLADVGRVLSCDETAGQESGNPVDRVEKNLQTKSHRGSGPSSPGEVGESGLMALPRKACCGRCRVGHELARGTRGEPQGLAYNDSQLRVGHRVDVNEAGINPGTQCMLTHTHKPTE